jgi:hypothetical protein
MMLPARDFFPNHAMAALWLALNIQPACQAKRPPPRSAPKTERERLDGGCVLLTPKAWRNAPRRKPVTHA